MTGIELRDGPGLELESDRPVGVVLMVDGSKLGVDGMRELFVGACFISRKGEVALVGTPAIQYGTEQPVKKVSKLPVKKV